MIPTVYRKRSEKPTHYDNLLQRTPSFRWTELTQKQFAQSIGRSEAVIQTYEQGTRNYTFETLLEIAQTHHIRITIEKMKK